MLQTQTVEPGTLTLLEKLMDIPELRSFGLVGGTALSLKFGHRISIDLDLFSHTDFNNLEIIESLKNQFGDDFEVEQKPPQFGIFCFIEGVKVDIIRYPHPLIRPLETIAGIRMYSNEDIIAMKVQAILGRAKKKDFWDIAELLKHYKVKDFIDFHQKKFSTQNSLISVPQAISYFSDAEESEDPVSLKGQTWPKTQKFIQKKVAEYLH
jgi:predicted nucleotidyltransferase component of viral defense system